MRILLVEDDALLGDALQAGLKQAGHAVDWTRDGVSAETALATEEYAAVVLDLGLPRKDGLDVLRNLRARKRALPVLILTARDTVEDRIRGLDAGADDYLVKPFDLGELNARLRALLRRAGGQPAPVLAASGITLDPASRIVEYRGKPVELSSKEYACCRP
jgi:DNA-binding response OmpR family regulator